MKRESWKLAILSGVALLAMSSRDAWADEALSLRRVMLSSGGVGYFEYEANIRGDADLPLQVRLDQVDDVLKSIVVFDDKGSAGEITLPAKMPENEPFQDLPFEEGALSSEASLFSALRGAEVRVTVAGGEIHGRILSVTEETAQLPDGQGTIVRHRLAITSEGAVNTVILEDATRITLTDPALQQELDAALSSMLDRSARGRRTLTIRSTGQAARVVRVAFVVSVPLWKSTYRLTLPMDPHDKKAALQGWAVLENQSGTNWQDVDLTLVSGNPVTFRQALYASYYVNRPEIPVEVVGRVLPRLEGAAQTIGEKMPSGAVAYGGPNLADHGGAAGARGGMPAPMPPAAVVPADTREAPTQVVFHLPSPVTLESGRQALIPIIDARIGAERVSLYQPDVNATNPLASANLQNDTDTGLPPGVLTTYERDERGVVTYVGDARLATLPKGEHRLVSFGVDSKVHIDSRVKAAKEVTLATIADGVLKIRRTEQRIWEYTITGAALEPRTVILENPRLGGFELVEPAGAVVERTDAFYRIRVEVAPGGTVTTRVVLARPKDERIMIAELASASLRVLATSTELPTTVRDAVTRVAGLSAVVDEKTQAVTNMEADLARIVTEQTRIRDNLKVVPSGSSLYQRYLGSLGDAEDRIADLTAKLAKARKAVEDARTALNDAIRALKV